MSRLRERAPAGQRAEPEPAALDLDDDGSEEDLDDDAPARAASGGAGPGRDPGRPRARHHRLVLAAGVGALVVVVALSLVRHEEQREQLRLAAEDAARAARADARVAAWQAQQQRSADHDRREVEALSLLPEDLAWDQRLMASALEAAAPRLPDLDWSSSTTRTVRTTAQRLGDGSPRLLDAQRTARPSDDGTDDANGPDEADAADAAVPVPATAGTQVVGLAVGSAPVATVAWRITTPLTQPPVTDPCAVAGVVVVPDGGDGQAVPECTLKTTTSPSGEEQVVAVRSWQRTLGGSGADDPVRAVTVHQAVLLVEGRWTFAVSSTAVGSPGSAASVPLLSLDQASLAVRWAADAARGRPTPAPLRGTPLPGFAG